MAVLDASEAFTARDFRGRGQGLNVTIDTREVVAWAEVFRRAGPKGPLVAARALNWVGARAGTQVQRTLARQTGLTYAAVIKAVAQIKASPETLEYTIRGRGQFLTLRSFGAVQRKRGVSARPWGQRHLFRGTFIVPKLNNQVFRRDASRTTVYLVRGRGGRTRERIGPSLVLLYGPAIPRELLIGQVPVAFQSAVRDLLPARTLHELQRLLPRRPGGAVAMAA